MIPPSTISKIAKIGISNGKLRTDAANSNPPHTSARMPSVVEKLLLGIPLQRSGCIHAEQDQADTDRARCPRGGIGRAQ